MVNDIDEPCQDNSKERKVKRTILERKQDRERTF
jgi:hypothetical protein